MGLAALALSAALASGPAVAQAPSAGALAEETARAESRADELPVAAFYQAAQQQPTWHSAKQVEALVRALKTLRSDGLVPADYLKGSLKDYPQDYLEADGGARPLEAAFAQSRDDAEARAAFDVRATRALLLALDHLQRGRLDPEKQVPGWETARAERRYSMARVVDAVNDADIEQALSLARPELPAYGALREALKTYRALGGQTNAPLVPSDEALRRGNEGDAVTALRRRLAYWGMPEVLPGDPAAYARIDAEAPDLRRFDAELETAVKRFQRRHLLDEDGVVGGKTRRALNASVRSRVDALRVNLERARWMQPVIAREPGVWVDIAGYRMHYTRPGGARWSSRVIVGRSGRETPVLHSAITHLTVNPTWTVPPTIWREDVLPRLRRGASGYLNRRNMQVVGPDGARLDPASIDWQAPGNVMLRQSAGPSNPLGRMVVRFPNSQLIYLHDTPSRGLFNRDRRALSSGCVRVEGVRELVRMLLEDTGSRHRLGTLLQRSQSDLNVTLPERIPVALVYLTAWPDEAGEVTFRPDIYRRDDALLRAL
ncbi:L,D-transpeptidase family protein [Halomonas garicola]|uniref:L,D-transpeptidase family protein n=1 Tax=Halomonas garicola TaxID=1690008 RepID=UPI00289BD149|nr:L,D-transpeptidase family protein [Halomonas garicola]